MRHTDRDGCRVLPNGGAPIVGDAAATAFGTVTPDGQAAPHTSPLPEPGKLALLTVAVVVCSAAAWRRRSA